MRHLAIISQSAVLKYISSRLQPYNISSEQSSKGKGRAHKSTNRKNQSKTGKLGKLQWP
jgi:hypothetical protein